MSLDLIQLELLVALGASAMATVGMVWTWLTKRGQLNKKDIDEIESRVTTLETKMEALPTHEDLTEIQGRITRVGDRLSREVGNVRAEVGEVQGAVTAGNRLLDNILKTLLDRANT